MICSLTELHNGELYSPQTQYSTVQVNMTQQVRNSKRKKI